MDGISGPIARVRRRTAQFRQKDLQRALKAVQDAGLHVAKVEIDQTGKIAITTDTGEPEQQANPWDAVPRQ